MRSLQVQTCSFLRLYSVTAYYMFFGELLHYCMLRIILIFSLYLNGDRVKEDTIVAERIIKF